MFVVALFTIAKRWKQLNRRMDKHNVVYSYEVKGSESLSVVSDSLRPLGNIVHGILQARILEWVAFPFSRGSSQPRDQTSLLHCKWILYQLSHKGSPRILEWIAYPFSSGSSRPGNRTRVSFIAGGSFTNWVIREPYNRILFSHEKNEVLIHVTTWINLENMLS